MGQIAEFYADAIAAETPAEDARFALPNAAETQIVVTANARALLDFFTLRTCNNAQWEIRELAFCDAALGEKGRARSLRSRRRNLRARVLQRAERSGMPTLHCGRESGRGPP